MKPAKFENTLLYKDASRIASSLQYGSLKLIRATFSTHKSEFSFSPYNVLAMQVVRDYIGSHSDTIELLVMMGLGDYIGIVLPKRDELLVTLSVVLYDNRKEKQAGGAVYTKKYKAILIDKESGAGQISDAPISSEKRDIFNLRSFVEVSFQLIEEPIYSLMQSQTGGLLRQTTVGLCLSTLINSTLQKNKDHSIFSKDNIKALDILEPDHVSKLEQIQVPMGTKILELPNYIQNTYGVYGTGLGSYLYKDTWWIYPLYKPDWGSKKRKNTLNFFFVPRIHFSGCDNSYEIVGDVTNIIIYSGYQYSSRKQENALTSGSGARYGKAQTIADRPQVKDNKVSFDRSKKTNEYVAVNTTDEVKNLRSPKGGSSANPYQVNSELAKDSTSIMSFVWDKADPTMVYPGADCTINYLNDKGSVTQIKGRILSAVFKIFKLGHFNESLFGTQAAISICVPYLSNQPNEIAFTDQVFSE